MSEPFRLPDELVDVQSRLIALTPAPSRIDLDETMYRAGWAAATAQGARRRPVWATPLASAAAAAIVAVAATRLLWPAPSSFESPVVALETPIRAAASGQQQGEVALRGRQAARQIRQFQAPLLAMRERALQFEFDDPKSDLVSLRETMSTQQLRQEFLPPRRTSFDASDANPWRWIQLWTSAGETT